MSFTKILKKNVEAHKNNLCRKVNEITVNVEVRR